MRHTVPSSAFARIIPCVRIRDGVRAATAAALPAETERTMRRSIMVLMTAAACAVWAAAPASAATTWTIQATPNPSSATAPSFNRVSCPTATSCFAAATRPLGSRRRWLSNGTGATGRCRPRPTCLARSRPSCRDEGSGLYGSRADRPPAARPLVTRASAARMSSHWPSTGTGAPGRSRAHPTRQTRPTPSSWGSRAPHQPSARPSGPAGTAS